jgi:hypothetical protein
MDVNWQIFSPHQTLHQQNTFRGIEVRRKTAKRQNRNYTNLIQFTKSLKP